MIDFKSRERKFIVLCAVIVLATLLHMLIISPALKKRADLERRIIQARTQLVELMTLEQEYAQILEETKKINSRMAERPRGFSLFSFLDQTANRLNLKNNLASMKPSKRNLQGNLAEDLVEVRLEGISLENLVAYLYEIEKTGVATAIASIRIQPESRTGEGLNASLLVTSLGPL